MDWFKGRLRSFYFAGRGIFVAWQREPNFRVHVFAAIVVTGLGFFLRISFVEWLAVLLAVSGVVVAELFNSALEKLGDAISSQPNAHIRDAKDMAAGAVLLASLFAVSVGIGVFLPRLIDLLR
jgi:diacylglycerol kinase (ATP)